MRLLWSICFVLFTSVVLGQQNNTVNLEEKFVPIEPTSAQMNKFSELPINYSTGTVDISIPLLDIAGKSINFPIQLKYNGGGIKVSDLSNKVGVGWFLDIGGAINRSIRSLPDEGLDVRQDVKARYFKNNEPILEISYPYNKSGVRAGYSYQGEQKDATRLKLVELGIKGGYFSDGKPLLLNIPQTNAGSLVNFVNDKNLAPQNNDFFSLIDNGYRDLEPDIYNVSVPGYSAKFSLGVNNKFSFISGNESKASIQTSVIDTLLIDTLYQTNQTFSNLYPLGMYTDSMMIRKFQPWEMRLENGMKYIFSDYDKKKLPKYDWKNGPITSWYLNKIIDENTLDTISFDYTYKYTLHPLDYESRNSRAIGYSGSDRLFLIDRPSGTGGKMAAFCDMIKTNFQKIKLFYTDQLDSIVVFDNLGNREKKVRFYYSKFTFSGRLRLDSVAIISHDSKTVANSYKFSYYEPTTVAGQSVQYSYEKHDYWEYYNNREASGLNIDQSYPDFKPQWPYAMMWSLTGIEYSEGRRQEFEYEPNTYSYITEKDGYDSYNSLYNPLDGNVVGGIRIKNLKMFDIKSNKYLWERNLSYTEEGSSSSSGVLNMFPARHGRLLSSYCSGYSSYNVYWRSHVNQFNSTKELPIVTYRNVRETVQESGVNNGYTQYVFYSDYETPKRFYSHYDSVYNQQYLGTNFPSDRYLPVDYLNPLNGKLKSKKIFDRQNVLLSEEINNYETKNVGGMENRMEFFKTVTEDVAMLCNVGGYSPGAIPPKLTLVYISVYALFPKHVYLKEKINNTYFGADKISNVEKYYYESSYHNQLTKTVKLLSGSDSSTTKSIYGLDLPETITNYVHYNKFRQTGFNPLIMEYNIRKGNVISAVLNNFINLGTTTNHIVQMKNFQTLDGSKAQLFQLTNGQFANYNAAIWEERRAFEYDSKIRIIGQKLNKGVDMSYIWNDNLRAPVAKIQNSVQANVALANFELPKEFGFNIASSNRAAGGYLSGRSYNLANGAIVKSGLNSGMNYNLYYWTTAAAPLTITGSTESTLTESRNGWNRYKHLVKNTSTLTLQGSAAIDELLLLPENANYALFEFDRFQAVTKLVGNQTKQFVYNNLQQLKYSLNDDLDMMGANEYNIGSRTYKEVYFSILTRDSVRRNNCAVGTVGSYVTFVASPGQFTSNSSQADADLQARNYVNQNLQNYANQNGSCLIEYKNAEFLRTVNRNGCSSGYLGTSVTYEIPKGTYTSTVSQADADLKAQQDFDKNGTLYFALNGECLASSNVTTVTITNSSGMSMEDLSLKFISSNNSVIVKTYMTANTMTLYLKRGGYGLILGKKDSDSAYYVKLNSSTEKLVNTGAAEAISLTQAAYNLEIVGEEIL
ncbi:hypothetical protein AAW12_18950 [Sphingobacterium sp. Ag1]|uniref:DUF5977 domain-containing protein n=1 Tax=Sphingobacterium sp. Ag1 TaxID=1643451 RepID=UPI000632B2CE|nr:DUF5977 domain-containing protein [Sphingobacterium sp. Ag1]KKO89684.1 hypothetical protein AAW12_18950 [Sphingobacterium sp. Ag1]